MTMPMRSLLPLSWNRNIPADLRSEPFATLQQEMNRLFENFGSLPTAFGSGGVSPRADIFETDKAVEIDVELPGIAEKDIDVTLSGDVLTIRGEKKGETEEKKKNYYLAERSYGSFSRSLALPFDANPEDISARFDKGILHIVVKKPETVSAKTARIPVKAG